ncbi:tRNA U34 2-thiouridine synthase MnmA/TrmU, contains the PP-loop ATPase domain [Clostridium cavendishii DSM 21758]|uniref:tRNA U34 2-thiouridine synthase MnmA/TrmU, contains the PP-loop ATPase domain n=1 Tax=Clostridium cavendishii DSM 21758 TaxID=1121302 RepID=A0A1M6U631_9CLOT|nr:DUF814 domain-containing protein [Clostridium cavendishii]SHK64601.1 tRNA U34 2-thiouridine synthase MnmA/TrmU, contains the PP-loop ATPase domain [Clostridium cavendishii DSM 21758]
MTRALAMISGGLDSILAAKLVKNQGVEVIGICFKSYFFGPENAKRMCAQIDIPLEVVDFSKEHFEMVKKPKHGHGKNMNPCIDCHAMMMKYSGELLKKFNADFIITGEVLNQRPMSQNRSALDIVKKESGFSDKILRPLCAKNLKPTDMEISGLIDREKLLNITGRGRQVQMKLADEWGIKDYPSPAGGCKLTEPNYSLRLRDLVDHQEIIDASELDMLKLGRHFRNSEKCKIIVARTGEESELMKKYLNEEDILFIPTNYTGALVIVRGDYEEDDLILAARIAARYSKGREMDEVEVKYGKNNTAFTKKLIVVPAKDKELEKIMINLK